MTPSFIGIGAPKAGTTWLATCLRRHPEVFLPLRKEINVFDYADFDETTLRDYERHFEHDGPPRLAGEFSTRYFHSVVAPRRIAGVIPDVKLVVSLRNPVDQVYAHYWHLRRQFFHQGEPGPAPGLEEAIERFPALLLEPAMYHTHILRWLEHFPREQLLVLWFDDIASRPAAVLQELFCFLGVSTEIVRGIDIRPPGCSERRGVSPRSRLSENLYRPLYAALVGRVYNPMKDVLGPRIAGNLKETIGARALLERVFFRPGYPSMTPTQRASLASLFCDEIARLSAFFNKDLRAWR